jgi:HlyD family secretion protein
MTANVTFVYADRDDALRVPNAALRFRPSAEVLASLRAESGANGANGRRASGNGADTAAPGPDASVKADGLPPRGAGDGDAARNGGANGGGKTNGNGAAGARGQDAPGRRTLWVLRGGKPVEVRVKTGISDGTLTEVLEGELQPGDACVVDASGGGSRPGGMGGPRGPRLL